MKSILEPEGLIAVFGAIFMGASPDGKLAVEVSSSKMAKLLNLDKQFDRAAAAFMREFAKGEKLAENIRMGDPSSELDKVANKIKNPKTKLTTVS